MAKRARSYGLHNFIYGRWEELSYWEKAERAARERILERIRDVAIWWADRWPLPKSGSSADRAAALLLERDSTSFADVLARLVPALTNATEIRAFEHAIGPARWGAVLRKLGGGGGLAAYFYSRREDVIAIHILESIFIGGSLMDLADLEGIALRSFVKLVPPSEATKYPVTLAVIAKHIQRAKVTDAVRRAWTEWISGILGDPPHDETLACIAAHSMTPDAVRNALGVPDPADVLHRWRHNAPMLAQAFRVEPESVTSALRPVIEKREKWELSDRGTINGEIFWTMVGASPELALEVLPVEIGFESIRVEGELLTIDGREALDRLLNAAHLIAPSSPPEPVVRQAALWCTLHRLSKYSSWNESAERRGMQAVLRQLADRHPEEIVRALPWLVQRFELVREIEPLVVKIAIGNASMRNALATMIVSAHSATLRDRARGVLAIVEGFSDPGAEVAQDWLSFAARQLDGTPVFPHPLRTTSSTWISNPELEHILRTGIDRAAAEFAPAFRAQPVVHEDAHTATLLNEMAFAFRSTDMRLAALHKGSQPRPALRVARRQMGQQEENVIGCDVAFVVDVHVASVLELAWAEFVQVKKPEHIDDGKFVDRWRIDLPQLDKLLAMSATACYWLIGAAGEVFVIPARFIDGTRRGKKAKGESMTLSYASIRSMAIPLAQFVVDLLAGGWIGAFGRDIVRRARGEDRGWVPHEIFEITILADRENRG